MTPSTFHSLPWLLGWASLTVMGPVLMAKVIYKTIQTILYHLLDREQELHGKVVFLTGASSGLGKCLAHALYKRGCRLILASRNVKALQELKETLIQEYSPPELHMPTVLHLDLEDLNAIPVIVGEVIKSHNHIDVLINNAGISYRGEVSSTDISVDLKLMLVNYFGQVAITKAVLKNMISRKTGHIIGVSSLQGKIALPFRSCYAASKHALQSFFDSLRSEVSHLNIHVTVVSPGYIKTNLSLNAIDGMGQNYGIMDKANFQGMSPDSVAERIVRSIITKESDLVICPLFHRLIVCIRFYLPSLYFLLMKIQVWNIRRKPIKNE